jgi:RNA polymerase sigma-70 factor (ECF subfamily)
MSAPLAVTPASDTPLPRPTDKSLVRAFQRGDQAAAAALFARYSDRVRALASNRCGGPMATRFDSDDVVQSVFRTFFHGIQQSTYQVPADGQMWGLLLVLALNKIRTLVGHHQAAKRDVNRTRSADPIHPTPATATADFLAVVVEDLMSHLPETNRLIVQLRLEGHEVKEIAARIGRSRRTVERVLSDFRDRLSEGE